MSRYHDLINLRNPINSNQKILWYTGRANLSRLGNVKIAHYNNKINKEMHYVFEKKWEKYSFYEDDLASGVLLPPGEGGAQRRMRGSNQIMTAILIPSSALSGTFSRGEKDSTSRTHEVNSYKWYRYDRMTPF